MYDDDNDNEEDEGLFDMVGFGDDDAPEDEPIVAAAPRAFRILWECVSPLITHESCVYLRRLQKSHVSGNGSSSHLIMATPMSDLEASRSNGFMAMLRMYMSRSLSEIGQPLEMKRTAEQRLQGLLYTFNFSRPALKLDTKLWKALTCILLEVVLFLDRTTTGSAENNQIPSSAKALEMTLDEYRIANVQKPILIN